MPKKKDLTGQKIGRLTVLFELPERKNGKIIYRCQCECGNEKDIAGTSLTKKNPTQSCGCLQRENTSKANRAKGLEGMVFGRLKVINWDENKHKWLCECQCGNKIFVNTNHLNQNHTQSCGCLQRDKTSSLGLDLKDKKFGYLTVLERDYEKSYSKVRYWKCQCDCGNIISVPTNRLRSGTTQSCGCLKMSHGELKIKQILEENNIFYQQEYIFPTCKNPKTGKYLRFDFFVENKYLIEFDGKQHFIENSGWQEELQEIKYRDEIKNQWCKENNIPLIRIPYSKLNTLCLEDLLL